ARENETRPFGRHPTKVTVESKKTVEHDIVIEEAETAGIDGRVLEPGGNPSAFASISAKLGEHWDWPDADDRGRFHLALVPTGGATLRVRAKNGARAGEYEGPVPPGGE